MKISKTKSMPYEIVTTFVNVGFAANADILRYKVPGIWT